MKFYLTRLWHNLNYYKNYVKKSGFTIIEAVLAILVLGASYGAIFALQTTLMRMIFNSDSIILRLMYIKNFFTKADIEKLYLKQNLEEKIQEPELNLKYSTKQANSVKGLEQFNDTLIEKVEVNWTSRFGNQKETFITFKFNPRDNKSDNK